jgi:ribosomal-protein-alanine N-acetyltransferase
MAKHELTDSSYLFESERLGFRKFKTSDLDPFFKMNSDQEVMKYFPSLYDKEQTMALMDNINDHIDKHGFGFFAIDILSTNTFIGFIGLKRTDFKADFTPCVEIGWRLDKNYWNQGLATEGALRCLEFAFDHLHLDSIYSFTAIVNIPSERVMKKIGMTKIDEFDHPLLDDGHILKKHCLYHLTKK